MFREIHIALDNMIQTPSIGEGIRVISYWTCVVSVSLSPCFDSVNFAFGSNAQLQTTFFRDGIFELSSIRKCSTL